MIHYSRYRQVPEGILVALLLLLFFVLLSGLLEYIDSLTF